MSTGPFRAAAIVYAVMILIGCSQPPAPDAGAKGGAPPADSSTDGKVQESEGAPPVPEGAATDSEATTDEGDAAANATNTAAETDEKEPAMLVTPEGLHAMLGEPHVSVLDVRSEAAYAESHIPGAVRIDLDAWKEKALSPGGLQDAEYWSQAIGDLGVSRNSTVVVYGDSITNAARAWWTLKYLGVTGAALLDGGWEFWETEGLPTSSSAPNVEPVSFTPQFQPRRLASTAEVKRIAEQSPPDYVVLDTRSAEEYSGERILGQCGGHVRGAVHLEWKDLLAEDGRFLPRKQLLDLFTAKGVTKDKTLVTHCQSGGRASVEAFALELVGYDRVKNYYAGWSEYSADEDAPVENRTEK